MAMQIDLKPGESVKVGGATIRLEEKSGQVARISIDAPRSIPIERVGGDRSPAKVGISRI